HRSAMRTPPLHRFHDRPEPLYILFLAVDDRLFKAILLQRLPDPHHLEDVAFLEDQLRGDISHKLAHVKSAQKRAPAPLDAHDSQRFKVFHRFPSRSAADAKLGAELRFGREAISHLQAGFDDVIQDLLLHSPAHRHTSRGPQTRHDPLSFRRDQSTPSHTFLAAGVPFIMRHFYADPRQSYKEP